MRRRPVRLKLSRKLLSACDSWKSHSEADVTGPPVGLKLVVTIGSVVVAGLQNIPRLQEVSKRGFVIFPQCGSGFAR
jgi:hypothetical protein